MAISSSILLPLSLPLILTFTFSLLNPAAARAANSETQSQSQSQSQSQPQPQFQPQSPPVAPAQEQSGEINTAIVGLWKTIDDKSKEPRAIVQITEENGVLHGKIIKLFPRKDRPPNPTCEKCEGDKKNQPILGLEFLWGLKKSSDTKWEGGEILDPESGSVYSSKAELIENGNKLKVRGFLGISILGRTQVWERAVGE